MGDKDFFLNPDDAQTLGDVNYMRKSVRVRRTFPKTLKNKDGFEVIKEVSATGNRDFSKLGSNGNSLVDTVFENPIPSTQAQSSITTGSIAGNDNFSNNNNGNGVVNVESVKSSEKRRQQDSSMDMFRNMARNIGKK
jgi:hypothetical protein